MVRVINLPVVIPRPSVIAEPEGNMSVMLTVKNEQARSRKRIGFVDKKAEPFQIAFEGGRAGKFRQPEYRGSRAAVGHVPEDAA